jgi:NDP-sugar pyrophosphorylase family protein
MSVFESRRKVQVFGGSLVLTLPARAGDLIHFLIDEGERVEAYQTDAFWYDVGSTEKYEKLDNGLVDRLF